MQALTLASEKNLALKAAFCRPEVIVQCFIAKCVVVWHFTTMIDESLNDFSEREKMKVQRLLTVAYV